MTGKHCCGDKKKNGTADTMVGQKSGPALAGPAAPATTALHRYTRYTKGCKVGGALKDAGSWLPLGVIKLTIFVCRNWLQ